MWGASTAGRSPGADDGRPEREKMIFMEKLQKQKEEAKAAYIKARNEWEETITAENIKGDFEKWKILCDRKADCRRLGVLI